MMMLSFFFDFFAKRSYIPERCYYILVIIMKSMRSSLHDRFCIFGFILIMSIITNYQGFMLTYHGISTRSSFILLKGCIPILHEQ